MKKVIRNAVPVVIVFAFLCLVACGGGPKVKLSEKGQLITSITWKLDASETLKSATDSLKDTTGIIADIKLEKDVKKFIDFVSETLQLGIDKGDPSQLSYSKTYGEGLFSKTILGYWEFNADESAIIMREWDKEANKEKEPVTYKIVELSKNKLILQKEGDITANIYFPKK